MYIGEDTYTVDLRKALPSTFSRPASQHGWIVRKHIREECNYNDRVIGVIEVNVDDASKWLGEGELLSQDNFFPDYSRDQGYNVLLWRQKRSGVPSKWKKIIPVHTICNYHYSCSFYSSGDFLCCKPKYEIKTDSGATVSNITDLYALVLENGWSVDTCVNPSVWDEENPVVGQSLATALLVQQCFGGDLLYFKYSNRTHHFNLIHGCYIDLTFQEINPTLRANFPPKTVTNLGNAPKNTYEKHFDKLSLLVKNCGLTTLKLNKLCFRT